MFQKRLNIFVLFFLIFVSSVFSSWLEECPERRKSLGRCLAGLCPFEAECIDDHCCKLDNLGETLFSTLLKLAGEFPKLPMVKPESVEITNVTEKPAGKKATVTMLPFEKLKPSESAEEEEDNKPLTSEEVKQAGTPLTTTTTVVTTTTTRRPKNKKRPLPTIKFTTTTVNPIQSSTEDPLCFDGSYSIGECMDGYCPEGYACENGYCCKCPKLPCGKLTTANKPTNIFTLTPDSFENSNESSEEKSEEDLTSPNPPPSPTTITTTTPTSTITTRKPKMKKFTKKTTLPIATTTTSKLPKVSSTEIPGTSPATTSTTSPPTTTTTTLSTTTEEDYSTKDVCLEGYPIGECVDGKCPESHECIQNYCCEITPAINCSDLVRSCKKHLCNKIQYLNFMTEQCGRTCRRCDKQNQVDLKPKRPKRCRDSRNDCEEWAAEGFCKSALYSLEQKRHLCGKSCKLC